MNQQNDHAAADSRHSAHMDHGAMGHMDMEHAPHEEHMAGPRSDHASMVGMDHGHMNHEEMGHMNHEEMGHMNHQGMGHMNHANHVERFRRLFWIMLVMAIPVVGFSGMFADVIGYRLPDAAWVSWISPALGTVIFFWGGWPFLTGAVGELRERKPAMMTLITLAISVAYVASLGASVGLLSHHLDFWWELALLVVIMLLGHWIEMRSLAQTSSALDSLAALLPDQAERVTGETTEMVAPADLAVGDVVLVRPGAAIPADGKIVTGSAAVDESMVTGESTAVRRVPGENVVAGTVATDSALRVQVTAVGDATALAGIQKLVADAQASSSRAQRLADRAASLLFWFALGAAAITAIVWTAVGSPDAAVIHVITVLVIACPHALGLAIPLVVSIATERAARGGVLITDRLALESMRNVDAVVFDKTGTLTKGAPTLSDIETQEDWRADEVLALAAAAESESEHPLARAIVAAGNARSLAVPPVLSFTSIPALGVSAKVGDATVEVGGPLLLKVRGLSEVPATEAWKAEGSIVLHVVVDNKVAGALRLADEIRPESREAVSALHAMGTDVIMMTGDADAVAQSVGRELGIDRIYSGVRPEDKSARIVELKSEGKRVAMVGDGVNDAPALAQADVGIAIGAGTDVAIGSAGVVLASSDPRSVLSVVELSRAAYRKMQQNLWWAAGYNAIAVPLAAGVLAPVGFVLPMSVGALLMSASTVVVALNAQLLRKLDLTPEASTRRLLGE